MDARNGDLQDRLDAPKRAASLTLISSALYHAGRYAMYERTTVALDERMVALCFRL